MSDGTPELSMVIPVYQAVGCLPPLGERLHAALQRQGVEYEIIFVDDGSTDGSWLAVRELAQRDPRVKAIRLSRNFGQHYAITAGFVASRGRFVVVMDCDLQDAPEDIALLYQKALEGYDIVLGAHRKFYESFLKSFGSRVYHAAVQRLTGYHGEMSVGSFSLLSRKVVDAFLQLKDAHRHYLILLRTLGFRQAIVELARHPRASGRSSYSLLKLKELAIDGIVAQSNILLRWSIQIGLLASAGALLLMLQVIYIRFARPGLPIGWSSLMATVLLVGGLILMSLGILGLYIDKIFFQTKNRPLYLIDEKINC